MTGFRNLDNENIISESNKKQTFYCEIFKLRKFLNRIN